MEEEMSRLRETTKQVKLEMRKMHEKELEDLTKENTELKKKLDQAQQQFNEDMAVMLKKFEGNVHNHHPIHVRIRV
jgi:predicted RNase H-like nuclease (RuvC/YqgF family)